MTERIEYFLFICLTWLARRLTYQLAGTIGRFLGGIFYYVPNSRKRIALDNLAKAFPEKTMEELKTIAEGAFKNYGIAVLEMMWVGGQTREKVLDTIHIPDRTVIDQNISSKGFLLLSAHFGGWEFLLQGLLLKIGLPSAAIVQTQRNKRINAMVDATRRRFGTETITMRESLRRVGQVLREGKLVVILSDQSGSRESLYVDFFGRPAATHRGVAVFSLKYDAPIVLILLVRQADGTYSTICEAVDRSGLSEYSEENVIELTKRHTALLEKYIRLHPDQWLWMHKRWKHTDYYNASVSSEGVT